MTTHTMLRGETNAQALLGPAMPPNVRALYEVTVEETYLYVQRDLEMNPESLPERTHATYMAEFDYESWLKNFNALADELFGPLEGRSDRLVGLSDPDAYKVKSLQGRLSRIPTATRKKYGIRMPKAVRS